MTALVYPESIAQSGDYIKFEFGKYETPFKTNSGAQTRYQTELEGFTPTGEPVYLYLPTEIVSNFNGNWTGRDVTGIAQFALGTVGQGAGELIKTGNVGAAMAKILGASTATGLQTVITGAAGAGLADALTALGNGFSGLPGMGANLSANDVLQLTSENIVNPNTELLYGGASLRTHGYSFKMIAQSASEADSILKIVERFKVACAPKSKNTIVGNFRNFIGIPDLCKVTFHNNINGKSSESPYLPKYKVSGITSVSVNYVTEGQFISYQDGKPLGVVLSVALTETKLVFDTDITREGIAR